MKHKINIEIIELEKKNYHLFINIKVNGNDCRLLIDSGASKTVFDAERILRFVKQKKIKANESKSVGLGIVDMETKVVKLKDLKIGKLFIEKMEVAVLPISHVNATYKLLNIQAIDGVLGSDFLMKYNAVVDYGKSVVKLTIK